MGKERIGFVDWMVDNNVFNIEADMTLSSSEYSNIIRTNSVLIFMNLHPSVRDSLYASFDEGEV